MFCFLQDLGFTMPVSRRENQNMSPRTALLCNSREQGYPWGVHRGHRGTLFSPSLRNRPIATFYLKSPVMPVYLSVSTLLSELLRRQMSLRLHSAMACSHMFYTGYRGYRAIEENVVKSIKVVNDSNDFTWIFLFSASTASVGWWHTEGSTFHWASQENGSPLR